MPTKRIHDHLKKIETLHNPPNERHLFLTEIEEKENDPSRYNISMLLVGMGSLSIKGKKVLEDLIIVTGDYSTFNIDELGSDIQHEIESLDEISSNMEKKYQDRLSELIP